jgi:hypothetical protein
MSKATAPVYQIKVSLKDSDPLIWRQLLVSSETKLTQFHHILQAALGWTDSHLHLFRVGPVSFGYPHQPGDLEEMTAVDERSVKLCHLVPARRPFMGEFRFEMDYTYDFGDSWEHEIVFEDVLLPDAKRKAPICLAGENACPPEDSGGIWRWNEHLSMTHDSPASDQVDASVSEEDADEFEADCTHSC